jgi:hypothetical protein
MKKNILFNNFISIIKNDKFILRLNKKQKIFFIFFFEIRQNNY